MPDSFNPYESMSTAELQALLKEDSEKAAAIACDLEAIMEITEVLARRERENPSGSYPDPDAAWSRFEQDYLPQVGSRPTVLEMGPAVNAPVKQERNPRKHPKRSRHVPRFPYRIASIAAILVLCLFGTSVTASAFGFDWWDAFVRWTSETFGFVTASDKAAEPEEMPEILQELRDEFFDLGYKPWNVIPSYFPDGYEEGEILASTTEYATDIVCQVTNGNDYILLQYRIYGSDIWTDVAYEKDLEDPELYKAGGVQHYITTNKGKYKAVWKNGDFECGIFEVSEKNELLRMIDSIYGGDR